jgi:zinc finger protein
VERVAKLLSRDSGSKQRAEEVLTQIEEIKLGKERMTLIIADPSGNSAIISDKIFFERENFTEEG